MSHVLARPRKLTGRHVLFLFVGFFLVVFAVDGIFAYFAVTSWPGVARGDAYQAGLRYNQTLDEARRQAALGWRSSISLDPEGALIAVIADRGGNSVADLDVSIELTRTVSDAGDATIRLAPTADGGYKGLVPRSLVGKWHVTVRAVHADGRRYRMIHEIFVRP